MTKWEMFVAGTVLVLVLATQASPGLIFIAGLLNGVCLASGAYRFDLDT